MEIEYKVIQTKVGQLEDDLNLLTKEGWVLHTILDWEDGRLVLVMEGAKAPEQKTPEPMRLKGYVNT